MTARKVADEMRPLIALFQRTYGLPAGFWDDDYVLGFLGTMIGLHIRRLSVFSTSSDDTGYMLQKIFADLSNMNGVYIARNFTRLAYSHTNSFNIGADNAVLVFGYVTNKLRNEDNHRAVPDIKASLARSQASADGENVGALLMNQLFLREVANRFGISVPGHPPTISEPTNQKVHDVHLSGSPDADGLRNASETTPSFSESKDSTRALDEKNDEINVAPLNLYEVLHGIISVSVELCVRKGVFGSPSPTDQQISWMFGFIDSAAQGARLSADEAIHLMRKLFFDSFGHFGGEGFFIKVIDNQAQWKHWIVEGGQAFLEWTSDKRTPPLMPTNKKGRSE